MTYREILDRFRRLIALREELPVDKVSDQSIVKAIREIAADSGDALSESRSHVLEWLAGGGSLPTGPNPPTRDLERLLFILFAWNEHDAALRLVDEALGRFEQERPLAP